jgi:hypothetical protein
MPNGNGSKKVEIPYRFKAMVFVGLKAKKLKRM